MNKDLWNKICAFGCTCAWLVGGIGGLVVSLIYANVFIALCVAGVAAMAEPFVRDLWLKND